MIQTKKVQKIIEIESKRTTTRIFRVEFSGDLTPVEAITHARIPKMHEKHPENIKFEFKLYVCEKEVERESDSSYLVYVRYSPNLFERAK